MAELTKLQIFPCDEKGKRIGSDSFEVLLNPSTYSHGYTIDYNKKESIGTSSPELKFNAAGAEKVNFDIVLDGTGVVNGSSDVKKQLKKLKAIAYDYDGDDHQPNHVTLLWGSFIFFGRLDSLSVEYTLFKPSGDPLRAKVKLAFSGFVGKEEEALRANRQSSDLTHRIDFKAGDTLPLLCHRIYKNSGYYLQVARLNDIDDFRDIKPGTRLHFPPLR